MMIKSKLILFLCLLTLFCSAIVSASSVNLGDISVVNIVNTTAGNATNTSAFDLGSSHTYNLEGFSLTDASTVATSNGCNESFTLYYSTDGSSYTGVTITAKNSSSISQALSQQEARYVKAQGTFTYDPYISNCTISDITVTYIGGYEDMVSGLPSIGTDTGNFLVNLAPGVGAFIIIMGVFGGVGAIIFAIVSFIRKKFEGE